MCNDPILEKNIHQLTIDGEVIREWVASYSSYDEMSDAHEKSLEEYLTTPFGEVEVEHRSHSVVSYVLTLDGKRLLPEESEDIVY